MNDGIDKAKMRIHPGLCSSGWIVACVLLAAFYACVAFKPAIFSEEYLSPTGMPPDYVEYSLYHAIMTRNDNALRGILSRYPHLANSTPAMVGITRNSHEKSPPIFLASGFGTLESISMLARSGANLDVTESNQTGYTPLHELIYTAMPIYSDSEHNNNPDDLKWRLRKARVLLENGANPNARDVDGRTPLFLVGVPESVELLVQYGASATVRDNAGNTPLLAIFKDPILYRLPVIIAMAKHKDKFDFKAKDSSGMTPKDYLKRYPDAENLNGIILKESGLDILGM